MGSGRLHAGGDVDGSSVHKAQKVREYVAGTGGRLELFFLPPYSPELNPDEWVNKNVSQFLREDYSSGIRLSWTGCTVVLLPR